MNAPDKIYLNKYMIRPGMLYPAQYPADTPEFEYIRKDAMLEWAKDMKAETEEVIKQHPEDESLWAEMHWWEAVMAKINAM